jgi:hypothetical protein
VTCPILSVVVNGLPDGEWVSLLFVFVCQFATVRSNDERLSSQAFLKLAAIQAIINRVFWKQGNQDK